MEDLNRSINEYKEQLQLVTNAITIAQDDVERESLLALQSEMQQLIQLTQDSLDAKQNDANDTSYHNNGSNSTNQLDEEYALFMQEMSKTGAYDKEENKCGPNTVKGDVKTDDETSDIEDELASLLGMKCAVYHTHKWGGQPSLHNAMVSSVEPRQNDDQFSDLQVRVLFTHPTHAEMLPCPYFLDGECKFTDEQCRYSHGSIVQLSSLNEAIEPCYETIKAGSRILLKLKPPNNEDVSVARKTTEKYHLWHIAVVKSVDFKAKTCIAKFEHGFSTGEKRKMIAEEFNVSFEDIFPLNNVENTDDFNSDDSLSDTEYPDNKLSRVEVDSNKSELIVERFSLNNTPAIGEWERHTRGIGSKLMLSMGYVPGTGLGATGEGRIQPVEAQVLPVGKGLDHCMDVRNQSSKDPLKVQQRLKRLKKREEDRNKRAYEREKERERRNVFNFLNRTLGETSESAESSSSGPVIDYKQSSTKDLNIEQFKITQDCKKLEQELMKLKQSVSKYPSGTSVHLNIKSQIGEKTKELDSLKSRGQRIEIEQKHRKDKKNMTVF